MTERVTAFLRRQPRSLLAAAGLGTLAVLEVVDYFAPPELSFLLFYVGPVLFLVWFVGRWAGFLGAALTGAFWTWEDVLSPHAYPSMGVADWNIGMRLVFLVAFVWVVAELKGALERERRAAQERLERDVVIAQEVQARLFPQKLPRSSGLDLHGVCRPARGVAGDYYDFLDLGPGRVGIAVGDVAGKGISAALLMANLQGALHSRSALSPDEPPDEASRFINAQLHARTDSRRFATFFWGIFDERLGAIAYVNAGHNPPMLLKSDGTIERLRTGGPPLGVFPDARYGQASTGLDLGDTLLIFSDGVTEAPDPSGEEFGEARLERVLRGAAALPAEEICDAVLAAVFAFQGGGPQDDDITVVAGRRRPPTRSAPRPAS
jgi:serine phosphatase RsbU (regulator of sigma subunit)